MTEAAKFDGAAFDGQKPEQPTAQEQPRPPTANTNAPTEDELRALIESPAVFASKFYVGNHDGTAIRIAFMDESFDRKHIAPRFSVVMTLPGFMQFAQLIQNTNNKIAEQIMRSNLANSQIAQSLNKPASDRESLE